MLEENRAITLVVLEHFHEENQIDDAIIASHRDGGRLASAWRIHSDSLDLSEFESVSVPLYLAIDATSQDKVALAINDTMVARTIKAFVIAPAEKAILWMVLREVAMSYLWSTQLDFARLAFRRLLPVVTDYPDLIGCKCWAQGKWTGAYHV